MKKQITILFITALMLLTSCQKENQNAARRAGNKSNIVGTYVGTIYYTFHYSVDSSLGLSDESGTESDFILKIEETEVPGMDLKLSYIFTSDTTVLYLSNLIDAGNYYFDFPNQLNEEGVYAVGNNCYEIEGTQYDGEFINEGGVLRFCTRAQISTPGFEKAYITTDEVYTKQ